MEVRVPKYIQIKQDILDAIKSGALKPGDKVGGESALKKKYGVSTITVRKAFTDLITEGYLTGVQGVGTFVTKKRMTRSLTSISFSDELLQQGYQIDMFVDAVDSLIEPKIAQLLEVDDDQELTRVSRVRLANDEPVAYQSSYVDGRLLSLEQASKIRDNRSFYATLEQAGVQPTWVMENYSVRQIRERHVAELMNVKANSDSFFVTRTAYDSSDHVVEYAETHFNKDWYSVTVSIKM